MGTRIHTRGPKGAITVTPCVSVEHASFTYFTTDQSLESTYGGLWAIVNLEVNRPKWNLQQFGMSETPRTELLSHAATDSDDQTITFA